MKPTDKEIEALRKLARLKHHECIVSPERDVCVRPMLFNADGTRQITLQPDPYEFESYQNALQRLAITP